VKDDGTDMVFMITKFELSDVELLALRGWKLSPELTMITNIGPKASSSISTFRHPQYDIEERSEKLGYSHTTKNLTKVVKDMHFGDIPDEINLTGVDCSN